MVFLSQFLHLLRSQAGIGEHPDLRYISDTTFSLLTCYRNNKERYWRQREELTWFVIWLQTPGVPSRSSSATSAARILFIRKLIFLFSSRNCVFNTESPSTSAATLEPKAVPEEISDLKIRTSCD